MLVAGALSFVPTLAETAGCGGVAMVECAIANPPRLFTYRFCALRQKELAKRRVHLAATAFRAPRYSSMRARSRSSGNRLMATSGVEVQNGTRRFHCV